MLIAKCLEIQNNQIVFVIVNSNFDGNKVRMLITVKRIVY